VIILSTPITNTFGGFSGNFDTNQSGRLALQTTKNHSAFTEKDDNCCFEIEKFDLDFN
jgi:hypothetical protein